MEAPGGDRHRQEELMIMGCKEQQHNNNNIIIKGKRTKRLRPQSPIPFAIPTSSSSPDNGGVDGGSVTSSAELFQDSATEEEEDMANCLILLAQGQSRAAHNSYNHTSKRFLEAAVLGATAGKAAVASGGYYVYECKTCNRTFPSFQALGGHRASHKKPKANIIGDDHKNKHFGIGLLASDEDHHRDTQLFKNNIISNNPSPLSLHLSNRGLVLSSNNKSSNKVHECSICGAEFTSGQALGGHMRRHRTPIGANTTLSLTGPSAPPFKSHQQQQQQQQQLQQQPQQNQIKKQKNMLSLDLDLNLPAPSEDDHQKDQPKFLFASNQQPQAPPQPQPQPQQQQERLRILVDCHY